MSPTTKIKSRHESGATPPLSTNLPTSATETPFAFNGLATGNARPSKNRPNSSVTGSKVQAKRIGKSGGSARKDTVIPVANIPTARVDMQTNRRKRCPAIYDGSAGSGDGPMTGLASLLRDITQETQSLADTLTQHLRQGSRICTNMSNSLSERGRHCQQDRLSSEEIGTKPEPGGRRPR